MWLFSSNPNGEDAQASNHAAVETELLQDDAAELLLKQEALRAAEYREAQRKACGVNTPSLDASSHATSPQDEGALDEHGRRCSTLVELSPKHNSLAQSPCGSDLNSMYDFDSFLPAANQAETGAGYAAENGEYWQSAPAETVSMNALDDEEMAELERLRFTDANLRQQEQELEAQTAVLDERAAKASRALENTRSQIREYTGQLEAMASDDGSLGKDSAAVRVAEGLHSALDDATSILEGAALATAAAKAKASSEEQLMELASMTEELTDALEAAREGEEEARRRLTSATMRLQQQREQRLDYEWELREAVEEKSAEIISLESRLQSNEQGLAWERANIKELETCPMLENYAVLDTIKGVFLES